MNSTNVNSNNVRGQGKWNNRGQGRGQGRGRGGQGRSRGNDGERQARAMWLIERKYCKCSDCGTSYLIKWNEFPEGKYMTLFKEFCEKRNARTLFIKADDCPNCTPDSLWQLRQDIQSVERESDDKMADAQRMMIMSNTLAVKRAGNNANQFEINRLRNKIRAEANEVINAEKGALEQTIKFLKASREPRIEQYKQISQVRERQERNEGERRENRGRQTRNEGGERRREIAVDEFPALCSEPQEYVAPLEGFNKMAQKEGFDAPNRRLGMYIPMRPCGGCGKKQVSLCKAVSYQKKWYWLCQSCVNEQFNENKVQKVTVVDEDEDFEDDLEDTGIEQEEVEDLIDDKIVVNTASEDKYIYE